MNKLSFEELQDLYKNLVTQIAALKNKITNLEFRKNYLKKIIMERMLYGDDK